MPTQHARTHTPEWYDQLVWSRPRPVADFMHPTVRRSAAATAARRNIWIGSGLYAFSTTAADPRSSLGADVVYVGKSDGARSGLRARLSRYFGEFARPAYRSHIGGRRKHAGLDLLDRHQRGTLATPSRRLYVSWAGVVTARDLEGGLIALWNPTYNTRDEHDGICHDDERIAAHHL